MKDFWDEIEAIHALLDNPDLEQAERDLNQDRLDDLYEAQYRIEQDRNTLIRLALRGR